ncbi:3-beta hydroxysteroid dehydrogenase/isomerase family-domain-containing protein [Coprinopsis sp. MPI-PUGE-AT-0042]|nr:3-beta hydroxysteroid dehydrogenase/isomerase family-domain-containing protein [Coprinopsis sp. MPI-PUGE-AT-0042]
MGTLAVLAGCAVSFFALLTLYVWVNDRRLAAQPPSVASLAERATEESVNRMAEDMAKRYGTTSAQEEEMRRQVPPKTGRKYIVAGGGGFLGGWVVSTLLERGEDAKRIRVLDISPQPVNSAVEQALAIGLDYIQTDITDFKALEAAFSRSWDTPTPDAEGITVIHTVANIRFYERHPAFLPRSAKVNIQGTQNIIDACKSVGADVLVFTSSASIGLKSTRLFLWPWQSEPENFVQVLNDDEAREPKSHWEFFSNYAVTKKNAEELVRNADKTPLRNGKVLRTGCIRPGNGVYGPRGDINYGAFLVRKSCPDWVSTITQSMCYVENCTLAHLLYERRLLDLVQQNKSKADLLPDIGGQAFCVADPGPTLINGDCYKTLETLTEGECHFFHVSPTFMLILGTLLEAYYIFQFFVTSSFPSLTAVLPPVQGDILNLQTPLFSMMNVHLIVDDSRARLPPSQGGLGYEGAWTTAQGLWKTWHEHVTGVGRSDARSANAGVSIVNGLAKKGKKANVGKRERMVGQTGLSAGGVNLPVGPVEVHKVI